MIAGALDPDSDEAALGTVFMLGVFRAGEIQDAEEVEPGHPSFFSAPRFAKDAGRALLARHPDAAGFEVLRLYSRGSGSGYYRTVHEEWRS